MTETLKTTTDLNYGDTCACCGRKLECKADDKVRIKDDAPFHAGLTGTVHGVETSHLTAYINSVFQPVTVMIDGGKGAQRYSPKDLIYIKQEKDSIRNG